MAGGKVRMRRWQVELELVAEYCAERTERGRVDEITRIGLSNWNGNGGIARKRRRSNATCEIISSYRVAPISST